MPWITNQSRTGESAFALHNTRSNTLQLFVLLFVLLVLLSHLVGGMRSAYDVVYDRLFVFTRWIAGLWGCCCIPWSTGPCHLMGETTRTSFARLATASTKSPLNPQVLQEPLFIFPLVFYHAGKTHLIPVPFIKLYHKLYVANLVQLDRR